MKKIFIVLLNVVIIFSFIGVYFTTCFASEGNLSVPASVLIGENFTVTVTIPSDAVGYQGEISVKFPDGVVKNSGNLTVVTGITGDYAHPGNMKYTFTATQAVGTATVTVSNLKITDRNANRINSQTSLSGTLTIAQPASQPSQPTQPTTNTTTTTNTSTGNTGSSGSSGSSGSTNTSTTTPTTNEPTFTNTSETVYATETVNVRSGWGTSNSAIGKLSKGASVLRTGKGSNGWDRVTYNGKIGYVVSQYLSTQNPNASTTNTTTTNTTSTTNTTNTTNTATTSSTVAEPTWRETGDKVYATTNMNVRSGWDKSYSLVGGLKKGDSVTRIAVGSNGWDKIKYEGKTAYVMSKLLTTEEVKPDEKEDDTKNTVNENTTNKTTNTTNTATANKVDVTANMAANELDAYNKIVEEVGVLPAVGKSFSDYVYVVAVCSVIAMIGFIGLKIREKDED